MVGSPAIAAGISAMAAAEPNSASSAMSVPATAATVSDEVCNGPEVTARR